MKNNERDVLWVILSGDIAKASIPFPGMDPNDRWPGGDVLDPRWNPFPRHTSLPTTNVAKDHEIRVDRWYAPRTFFERMERQWVDAHWFAARFPRIHSTTPSAFSANINTWLAIVDKYGLDADYDREFLLYPKEIIVDILIYAYRIDDSGSYDTPRNFNGRTWTQNEFHQYFSRFILNHHLLDKEHAYA